MKEMSSRYSFQVHEDMSAAEKCTMPILFVATSFLFLERSWDLHIMNTPIVFLKNNLKNLVQYCIIESFH